MGVSVNSLGINRLSRDDRLDLVQEIWDTIAAELPPALLNESQRKVLEQRLADDRAQPDETLPWEQVKRDTLSRLHKP